MTRTALIAASLALASSVATADAPKSYAVGGIRAYLYYHATGKVGDRDITGDAVALFNTSIGEGDAGDPSNAAMVLVDLEGPSFANVGGTLTIEATAEKQRIAKVSYEVSEFFDEKDAKISLPMLLTSVGCDEVTITATLTMKHAKRSKKTATIRYGCGE